MISRRANVYGVEVVGVRSLGVIRGVMRRRVTWKRPDGFEQGANTRGFVDNVTSVSPGDIVSLIRDGNGSIIHIEEKEA